MLCVDRASGGVLRQRQMRVKDCMEKPAPDRETQARLLLGLVGAGIQASLTPAMHESECATQGMRCLYQLIDLERLHMGPEALSAILVAAEFTGFAGLNITYPFEQGVLTLLDGLSPEAKALGAVNTVVLRDGKRTGHNTDVSGFAQAFRHKLADANRTRVLQLGAGGAGAAVAHALLSEGVSNLLIYDVDRGRAIALADRLRPHFSNAEVMATTEPCEAVLAVDGLVNTTSIGMAKLPGSPIRTDLLRPTLWVADIIYFPAETELLRAARALGCRTMNGDAMAVFQAARAFEIFSGRVANAERMGKHFDELCQKAAVVERRGYRGCGAASVPIRRDAQSRLMQDERTIL
jgi:quinate/shikimate dehydrogenase (NAD+)